MSENFKTVEQYGEEFKRVLSSRSDGWIFGVCATIAQRTGWDLWAVRVIAAIALLSMTLLTGIAYVIAGYVFIETRRGTQSKISAWARAADGLVATIRDGFRNARDQRREQQYQDQMQAQKVRESRAA